MKDYTIMVAKNNGADQPVGQHSQSSPLFSPYKKAVFLILNVVQMICCMINACQVKNDCMAPT